MVKTLALFLGRGSGGGIFYCSNLNVDTLHTFIRGYCRTDGAALHVCSVIRERSRFSANNFEVSIGIE